VSLESHAAFDLEDAQEMLCLASLSYCRASDPTGPPLHDQRLGFAVMRGLEDLPPLKGGRWELAFGPASWRSGVSCFDDAAIFVVRSVPRPNRYVIAIRGTNPVSSFDWLLGDLWVRKTIPWSYGSPRAADGAAVSLSTGLGLHAVQQLRARRRRQGWLADVWRSLDDRLSRAMTQKTNAALSALASVGENTRRDDLERELGALEKRRAELRLDFHASAKSLLAEWRARPPEGLLDPLEAALAVAHDRFDTSLFRLLQSTVAIRERLEGGDDLLSFLAAAVAAGKGEVEVIVTGHSKGGAIVPAVALWLAETQGSDVPPADQWDPGARARVHAVSFAGPTAGNRAFAARCDSVLRDRFVRYVNPLDVVPHAWVPDEIRCIPKLYRDAGIDGSVLVDLVEAIAEGIAHLDYGHAGRLIQLPGKIADDRRSFVAQMIYQHLDGYLDALGLGPMMDTWTFFNPFA